VEPRIGVNRNTRALQFLDVDWPHDRFQQRQQPLNPHVASQPIRGLSWGPNALFSYYQTAPNLRLQTRAFRERERERERDREGFMKRKTVSNSVNL